VNSASETLSNVKQASKTPDGKSGSAGIVGGFVSMLAGSAIASGLAGVALNKGFGIPVPFLAGFFLIIGFLFFLRLAANTVAYAWFAKQAESAAAIAAANYLGSQAAAVLTGRQDLLDSVLESILKDAPEK